MFINFDPQITPACYNVFCGKELCEEKKQTFFEGLKEFETMTKGPFISGELRYKITSFVRMNLQYLNLLSTCFEITGIINDSE